jgi:ATP-binding cassette subfamily C protein CydD
MQNNKRLMKLLGLVPALFILAVVFGFLGAGLVVLQSLNLSKAINQVFLEKGTLTDILPLVRGILLIIFLRALFTFLNSALVSRVAVKIKTQLRDQLLQKIDRLGPAYLRISKSGELITSAIQGVEALDAYFSQYLPQIIIAVLMPLTILAVVFPLDLVSGLVFLITAPLIPFFMALVGRSSEAQTKKQWLALSRLGADFLDTLQGLTTLKTLGRSRDYADHVDEMSNRYRLATMDVLRITFLSAFVLELIATISTAVVAVEIGLRLLYGNILFEQAFFILLIAPEFYLPMRNLGMRYHAGMTGVTAAAKIFEVLDMPEPASADILIAGEKQVDLNKPFHLRFQDVSFTYPGREAESLNSVSFEITSGARYALVGRSGAGKSTILQLMMRFLQPSEGRILLDDNDINSFELSEWRKWIAWVPQTPMLFDTSLFENVRLNRTEISEEQVWNALQYAQLEKFTRSLPDGLFTPLHEWGSRLSGGQAQRVALARAFIKDAPLLLMDEPTAHLDPELETALETATAELMKGRTSVIIAHRQTTVLHADRIFVCEGGQIVQSGSHESLFGQGGLYARLFPSTGGDQ